MNKTLTIHVRNKAFDTAFQQTVFSQKEICCVYFQGFQSWVKFPALALVGTLVAILLMRSFILGATVAAFFGGIGLYFLFRQKGSIVTTGGVHDLLGRWGGMAAAAKMFSETIGGDLVRIRAHTPAIVGEYVVNPYKIASFTVRASRTYVLMLVAGILIVGYSFFDPNLRLTLLAVSGICFFSALILWRKLVYVNVVGGEHFVVSANSIFVEPIISQLVQAVEAANESRRNDDSVVIEPRLMRSLPKTDITVSK